jgi:hypothetical protein
MAAIDAQASFPQDQDVPALHAAVVTPSNTVDLTYVSRALVIGTAGDVKVTTLGGETVTLPAVPAGILPLRVTRVFATGTTAASISALW